MEVIKGKYAKKYFEKHKELPNVFDNVGRMPEEKQEKIFKKALEANKTWREIVNQPLKKEVLF